MSRLPFVRYPQLDEQGQALWDAIAGSRGNEVVNTEGGLFGPFNAWVLAVETGRRLVDLGGHLRFGTSLERRLLELAIVTVGAHWHAEFEWWAHSAMARRHGVSDAILDALSEGRPPSFDAEDERIVHAVAHQLLNDGTVDAETYADAQSLLGDVGVVELVSLCGYYTTVSFTLNAFAVGLPPGATPVWGDDPL
ncbi:MAG: carboxymuconolactone decarboxylase family protein [Actinomycetota bacterium]|nr:carboxymuconolactone decarboxylase family protein [Actinomycetota bacterium]